MFMLDPFGMRVTDADLLWAYLPSEPDRSKRDDEDQFESWVDAAQE